ncbi:MAG: bacterioferritin [Acidimicrobiales bacterium]|nr:bacterioferritin [Acidimicrobiales bacterium]
MRGSPEIIELLNEVLTGELTAINQSFVHAKMCENWGFLAIADKVRHESIDEMRHAEALVDRILYLDGVPNLQRLSPLRVGETVREQFESDLALEYAAIERLNRAVAAAMAAADNGSRHLFESILTSEEAHVDWLETQLSAIGQLGDNAYLAQQLRS